MLGFPMELTLNYIHVSHIYKEENKCVDTMANLGLALISHCWFTPSIRADLVTNRLG